MIERIILFLISFSIYFFPDQNLDPLFLSLFILAGILLAKNVLSRRAQFSLKINLLAILLLSLPFSMFVSTIFSSYKYPSLLRLGEIVLLYISFFLFSIIEEKEKKFTLDLIVILSLFHSIFSISKYLLHHQQRAAGNFLNPNHSAFVLLAGMILAISLFLEERKKGFIPLILPIITAIILSRSRSTLFALFIFLPLLFYDKNRMKKITFYLVPLFLLIGISFLVPNPLSRYLLRTDDPFSFRRFQIWNAGIKMFKDNWIVGVGPSNFFYRVEPYRFPEEERIARYAITFSDAHNDYIHILAELGILSIPFIFGVFLLSLNLLKNSINSQNWREKGTSIAILSILFNSFFTNSLFHPSISFLIIFLLSNFESTKFSKRFFPIRFKAGNPEKILLISTFLFLLTGDTLFPLISNKLLTTARKTARTESPEKSLKILKIAEILSPLNSSVKKEIGIVGKIVYLRTGDPSYIWSSFSALRESLRLNPHDSDSHKELAHLFTILLEKRKFEEAFKMAEFHWKKAISLSPFNPFHQYNLSQLYIIADMVKEAEEHLKKCIELEPNFIIAHYSLYKIYERMGEEKKKDEEKEKVIKLIGMFGNKNYPSYYFNALFSVPKNVLKEMGEM